MRQAEFQVSTQIGEGDLTLNIVTSFHQSAQLSQIRPETHNSLVFQTEERVWGAQSKNSIEES